MTRAPYHCPRCDRDTLESADDEIVDYRCAVCDHRVREAAA